MSKLYGRSLWIKYLGESKHCCWKNRRQRGSSVIALGIYGGFLKVGKGRGAGISFDFGENPINSFSVDWFLRKGGKSFTILADGVVINRQTLTKTQKKAGLSGHQDSYFFDDPVHN